jgi:predicted MPP superfamily phosphohydrolase
VRQALSAAGITDLHTCVHTIHRGEAHLHIAGLDSAVWRQDSLDTVLDQLPQDGAVVLLAHEPDTADFNAPTGRFDLQLSGHSHGGQVHLPFIGMPVLPSYGQRYPSGRYQVGEMTLYTNRGLGTTGPLVRLGAPPEISLITLHSPSSKTAYLSVSPTGQ